MTVKYNIIKVYQGRITDEEEELTLMQLSKLCHLPPQCVIEMVDEGILEPSGASIHAWRFPFSAIGRVRKVIRFQNDLDINLAGSALVLDLLGKIEHLEAKLARR